MLTEKTEKLVTEIDELLTIAMQQVKVVDLCSKSNDTWKLVFRSIKLMKSTEDILVEQSKALDEINNKLNLLLMR